VFMWVPQRINSCAERVEPSCLLYMYKPLCDKQYTVYARFYTFFTESVPKEICDRQRVGTICTRLTTLAKI
jgi:hypothetical protein